MPRKTKGRKARIIGDNESEKKSPEMKFVKVLGKGSCGSVELFSLKRNDGTTISIAVKTIKPEDLGSLEQEVEIMSELRECPSILQLYDNFLVEDFDCNGDRVYKMWMEYAAAGTLSNFIQRNRTKLSDSRIKDFTRLTLRGLVCIHEHGYVHCDLKPDNLLLFPVYDKEEACDCSYVLKISDFGLSVKAGDKSNCWKIDEPWVGTPLYMSPESVRDGTTVEKTLDLWSLGCIVLEMYTGKRPWLVHDIQSNLLDHKAPEIPETVPCDAREFLEKCFARKPEERGTASELLLHPFLKGDEKNMVGKRTGMVLRFRKPNPIPKDIPTKPLKTRPAQQFKKVAKKPRTLKTDTRRPLRSNFVPVQ